MLKKMILAGGALALLSGVTVATPMLSYTRCGVSWLRDSAGDTVPVEWELKRARQMIADLKPESRGQRDANRSREGRCRSVGKT